MRTFIVTLMAVFLVSLPIAETVEAKRFGGGSSFGKSFSSPKKRQVAPAQKQSSATQQKGNSAATKKSGFGGLAAGLLAGGIFGALLFGGAFDGIQFMDLLLIAAVIFVVFKIMSMRRRAQPQQEYAHNGPQQYETKPYPDTQQREAAPEPEANFKPMPSFESGWGSADTFELPSWFERDAFLEGAKTHFITLQKAWDENNWAEIQTYTSEDVLHALQQERAKYPAEQQTEVVSVMAEIANFIDQGSEVIVSINFYGWLKEDSQETTEFNETWHLSRDMTVENADWFIVGIQQGS
ncbi:MAG: transport protein [Neptuniibacter caesariensis]|uniref:Transport protein n=1 Tax=Neptuniibacter caesariensis TaxID=207954 RepID=A0A2G6JPB6_NEPCE|nr:MAG: transport protein [Neptuniibacter caesariensis]